MQNRVLSAVFVLAIIGSAGAGYLVGSSTIANQVTRNLTSQTKCTIVGETIGVVLQVLATDYSSHTEVPVSGALVNGQDVLYCNNERQVFAVQPATANSSGWTSLLDGGGGTYYLL
ncbi:MAG: hypothetical protein OK422_03525 [Thaumarchaeota archaeon]|nr:hypothetical protein [Nitrososphaerota archaeon]